MERFDLESLSLNELKSLQKDVARSIKGFEDRKRREAIAAAEAAARNAGFSLYELLGRTKQTKRTASPPRFRHPENPEVTWSGRGRQPTWYKDAIAAGISEDDLKIP